MLKDHATEDRYNMTPRCNFNDRVFPVYIVKCYQEAESKYRANVHDFRVCK